jgi:hypothetical protein
VAGGALALAHVADLTDDGRFRDAARTLAESALEHPPNHVGSLFKGETGAWAIVGALEKTEAAPEVPVLGGI